MVSVTVREEEIGMWARFIESVHHPVAQEPEAEWWCVELNETVWVSIEINITQECQGVVWHFQSVLKVKFPVFGVCYLKTLLSFRQIYREHSYRSPSRRSSMTCEVYQWLCYMLIWTLDPWKTCDSLHLNTLKKADHNVATCKYYFA